MAKPYRNAHHGMARRRHTSSRHYQRRRPSKSGCALWLLVMGAAAVTSGWQVVEVIL